MPLTQIRDVLLRLPEQNGQTRYEYKVGTYVANDCDGKLVRVGDYAVGGSRGSPSSLDGFGGCRLCSLNSSIA